MIPCASYYIFRICIIPHQVSGCEPQYYIIEVRGKAAKKDTHTQLDDR